MYRRSSSDHVFQLSWAWCPRRSKIRHQQLYSWWSNHYSVSWSWTWYVTQLPLALRVLVSSQIVSQMTDGNVSL